MTTHRQLVSSSSAGILSVPYLLSLVAVKKYFNSESWKVNEGMKHLAQFLVLAILIIPQTTKAQTSPTAGASADGRTLLALSISQMASVIPLDCSASGTAEISAGGRSETGSIAILTSGLSQSVESIQTDYTNSKVTFSNGVAQDSTMTPVSLEGAQSRQTAIFPLPLLAELLNDSEVQIQNFGTESVGGKMLVHLQALKSFASTQALSNLSAFSRKDIWIDPTTYLPNKISFVRREGEGANPGIQIDLFFSDYRSVQGVQFPFLVLKSFNGTPWGTFTFQSVAFNTGLPSSDFVVR